MDFDDPTDHHDHNTDGVSGKYRAQLEPLMWKFNNDYSS